MGHGVTLLLQSTVHALVFCTLSGGLPEPGRGMSALLAALVLLAVGGAYIRNRRLARNRRA